MAKLEQVKRNHHCTKCDRLLYGRSKRIGSQVSMRICFNASNYCIPCGYKLINEEAIKLDRLLNELKDKYGKELVVNRLVEKVIL